MLERYWLMLLFAYLAGLALSWLAELLLVPRPAAPWGRPAAALGVHIGLWTLLFAFELALFHRPYFGVANILVVQLLIILVSNAKYQALEEPFVFQDFEYFVDALRHPRLYLPFFGMTRALTATGGYALALWAGLVWEPSLMAADGAAITLAELLACTLTLGSAGLIAARRAGRHCHAVFDAAEDLRRLGMAAALWAYGRAERQPTDSLRERAPFAALPPFAAALDSLPDLVVIQSESFFDARRVYPQLRADILAHFDQLKAESIQYGTLRVAARGANTVRTEFGFLSGIPAGELGIHQYNPYRRLAKQGFPTLASHLKQLGYRTICVHPYHRSFYSRDTVLPLLGFDRFIGIEAFGDAPRDGPYVGDRALGARVMQLLSDDFDGPTYIHAITMENHGPLHWESVTEQDIASVLSTPVPDVCRDLVAYARHLRNANAMLEELTRSLKSRARASALCFFGDHIPIMPAVYRALGTPSGDTDYVLWRSDVNKQRVGGQESLCDVASLAFAYLRATGLVAVDRPLCVGKVVECKYRDNFYV